MILRVKSDAELDQIMQRLADAGIDYSGPVDTDFGKSIYFQDPNSIDIELTVPAPDYDQRLADQEPRARDVLADWTKKTSARKEALGEARAAARAAAMPPGPA